MGDVLLTGIQLYLNQFRAMVFKRIMTTLRSYILMVGHAAIPVVMLLCHFLIKSGDHQEDSCRLMSLKSYGEAFTVVSGTNSDIAGYKGAYIKHVENTGTNIVDISNENFGQYIVDKCGEDFSKVRLHYIAGATFESKSKIRVWFNNEPYHASPLALNLVHNAILREKMGNKYNGHAIVITNYPQELSVDAKIKNKSTGPGHGMGLAFITGISFVFVSSYYVLFHIRERIINSKHLQFVSGANILIFWIANYLWDMATFLTIVLMYVIVLACFQTAGYSSFKELTIVLAALFLFGNAMLFFTYLLSFAFNLPSTGYEKLTLIYCFGGPIAYMLMILLKTICGSFIFAIEWMCLLIPHYGLTELIINMDTIYSTNDLCDSYVHLFGSEQQKIMCAITKQCCGRIEYLQWKTPGLGRYFLFFGISAIVWFLIILLIDGKILKPSSCRRVPIPPKDEDEDEDVKRERKRVRLIKDDDRSSYHLILQSLTKYYKKFLCVQRLSVQLEGNQCFGLLGQNGAGKTTTFKMLTGDAIISYGEGWVLGLRMRTKMKKVFRHIGYCPQFDALLGDLTVRETIKFYCLLRGIPERDIDDIVQNLAYEFGFTRHVKKKIKECSGGTQRKISTAVSLIGNSSLVYLDEPTAGMDPAAKRNVWKALCNVRDNGKCLVLTSHSMEECEALCTRIAIMVNGQLKCIGSIQHLKSRFSEGYTLTVKVKKRDKNAEIQPEEIEPIDKFIKTNYPSAVLREQFQELLTYYISDTRTPWSKMFGIMEAGKPKLAIEDYFLGQATLEQVFLTFAKYQKTE